MALQAQHGDGLILADNTVEALLKVDGEVSVDRAVGRGPSFDVFQYGEARRPRGGGLEGSLCAHELNITHNTSKKLIYWE